MFAGQMETAETPLYRTMVRKPLVEFSHRIRDEILRLKTEKNRKNKILCLKKMDEQQLHRYNTKDKIYICMPSLFL